jgi:hypothetical protein
VPCDLSAGGPVRAGVGVPTGYAAFAGIWSTSFVALSDSHVNVNCVFGVVLDPALAADCNKLRFSFPFPTGVSGPCSAAVFIACEMIPPEGSYSLSAFEIVSHCFRRNRRSISTHHDHACHRSLARALSDYTHLSHSSCCSQAVDEREPLASHICLDQRQICQYQSLR